jgi:hypothetical protein
VLNVTVGIYGTVTHFSFGRGLFELPSSLSSLSTFSCTLRFSSKAVSGVGHEFSSSTGGGKFLAANFSSLSLDLEPRGAALLTFGSSFDRPFISKPFLVTFVEND